MCFPIGFYSKQRRSQVDVLSQYSSSTEEHLNKNSTQSEIQWENSKLEKRVRLHFQVLERSHSNLVIALRTSSVMDLHNSCTCRRGFCNCCWPRCWWSWNQGLIRMDTSCGAGSRILQKDLLLLLSSEKIRHQLCMLCKMHIQILLKKNGRRRRKSGKSLMYKFNVGNSISTKVKLSGKSMQLRVEGLGVGKV